MAARRKLVLEREGERARERESQRERERARERESQREREPERERERERESRPQRAARTYRSMTIVDCLRAAVHSPLSLVDVFFSLISQVPDRDTAGKQ